MRILIAGGAGYIGSHTLIEVLGAGHEAHVVDNLCNSSAESLTRVRALCRRDFGFTEADVRDSATMRRLIGTFEPEAMIHFAGLKAVGESVAHPLDYFDVNVAGSITLLRALREAGCRRFVFSSSATVYGPPDYVPIDEAHPLRPTNPYGRSKLQVEDILRDLAASDPAWSIALLRYFNPAGAHDSGRIGEDPADIPNNLMPYIAQVATGLHPALNVWGDDYDTPDGTGVRDYIHVTDLARAHLAAVDWTRRRTGCEAFNLGTGRGTSVFEMVRAFADASGRPVPVRIGPRRPGDIACCYANPAKAAAALNWHAEKTIADMCRSAWIWQSGNPCGYRGTAPRPASEAISSMTPEDEQTLLTRGMRLGHLGRPDNPTSVGRKR